MKAKSLSLAIDTNGAFWTWNCGWYLVDKDGKPLRTRAKRPVDHYHLHRTEDGREFLTTSRQRPDIRQQPLGHAEFRKAVKLVDPLVDTHREVLMGVDRPTREWRRVTSGQIWEHELFGHVKLLATDGCHAVVEDVDGMRIDVCFENLCEFKGVEMPHRYSETKQRNQTKRREKMLADVDSLVAKLKNL